MLGSQGGDNDRRMPKCWRERASVTGVEMQNRTTSAAWIRGVVKTFSSQGLDVPRLFADVGLDYTGLEDPELRWPTEQVSRLWTLAVERSRNPAIALFNPHVVRPDHYGVVGYAMMSSANLHAGLERLIRYLGIVSDAATISLAKGKGGQWVRLDLYGGAAPVPRQRMEYGLLTLLTFCRWMMGWISRPSPCASAIRRQSTCAPITWPSGVTVSSTWISTPS